ncbi:MAG: hypothetical protein R3185_05195 [Candidatus Thermoplasmatota archaeon]|nr:hypothetical protein [Candidatus Thermoplasmatota archaeon]
MRVLLILMLITPMGLAGCIGDDGALAPNEAAEGALDPGLPEPVETTWEGYILSSPTGYLVHNSVTEPVFAEYQAEGFAFEIEEVPLDMVAELAWEPSNPGAEIQIMVSSPREDGSGTQYTTPYSSDPHHCLRIPTEDLEPGHWQIMAHSNNAVDIELHFTVTTIGGEGGIVEHAPHSDTGTATVDERAHLPCVEDPR